MPGPAVAQYQIAQVAAALNARQRGASDPGEAGQSAALGALTAASNTYAMASVPQM